ncbi:MAG: hypothetical protein IKS41_03465 [Alphaproteobacteria bacterium]|nr:hypothetical protein [Alphaproteobacteria bacterium]
MPQTPKKKPAVTRSTYRYTRQDWERLNLELAALQAVQKKVTPEINTTKIAPRIALITHEIQEKAKTRKQKADVGIYIQLGQKTVQFFLDNPQYIPLMKHEMARRYQARLNGEDMRFDTLNNSVLNAHAEENAGTIYKGGICEWNDNYRRVRNDYIETMGRACQAAEMALRRSQPDPVPTQTQVLVQPRPQAQPQPAPTTRPPHPTFNPANFPNYWKTFQRSNEEEVNQLLGNRCDDNVPDMPEAELPKENPQPPKPTPVVQDLLPGFVMPPAEIPEKAKRVRRSTRKFRLPDSVKQRS